MVKFRDYLSEVTGELKTFELKTVAQIAKMDKHQSYAMQCVSNYVLGRNLRGKLKYLDKSENLKPEDEEAFLEEYGDAIKKMYKSPAYKKLAIKILEDGVESNSYNKQIPREIIDWALSIIKNSKEVYNIVFFDGYKLYQDLTVEESKENWASRQRASMTTKKAKVTFRYDKEYKKEFELETSGYWDS